ncbi:hypothetical protein RSAG8_11134, partial [Rhizoctonia solani AG-8 WAC10335]
MFSEILQYSPNPGGILSHISWVSLDKSWLQVLAPLPQQCTSTTSHRSNSQASKGTMPPIPTTVVASQQAFERRFHILLVAATSISPSSQTAAYMRVAAMTLAAYDWVITLRPEIRLYKRHKAFSKAVILFALIRYVSIAAIILSNVGFFGTGFSARACHHYHLVAPLTKMFATLISQVIISIRTYAISRKSRWVLYALSTLFIISCVPEVLGNAWQRKVVQNSDVSMLRFFFLMILTSTGAPFVQF